MPDVVFIWPSGLVEPVAWPLYALLVFLLGFGVGVVGMMAPHGKGERP